MMLPFRKSEEFLGDLWRDARFAWRSLRRQPGFLVAILLTLGIGVGANTAIFTVFRATLLRPLPYAEPKRLVHLWETVPAAAGGRSEASYPDFLDLKTGSRSLAGLEGYDATNVTLTGEALPRRAQGMRVTPGFFGLMGVAPGLGRFFASDEQPPNAPAVVVLSSGYWHRVLGGDPAVLRRTIAIDGRPYRVIGVLPPGFQFAPAGEAELWLPLDRSAEGLGERFNHWLNLVGRLRPGVTLAAAREDLSALMTRLASEYPETNQGRGVLVVPLRDEVMGEIRPIVLALFGAVGLVLLIACANIASLLVARALARQRELSVRVALGAGRFRLIRLLLAESLLIAGIGGLIGAALTPLAVKYLTEQFPGRFVSRLPFLRDVQVDPVVLLYALAIALVMGVGFGLVPAVHAARASSAELLRGDRVTGGGRRLRDVLVVGELALTTGLLVATGLLGRSLQNLLSTDLGFQPERVLTMRVALAGPRYQSGAAQQSFFESLLARTRGLPGVTHAGAVSNLPLNGGGTNTFRVEGQPEPEPSQRPEATMRGVAGEYFQTLGIRLVGGRGFDARDDSASAPVIMLSESLARRIAPAGSALGARLRFYAFPEQPWTVVGVVGDVKTGSLDADPPPTIYYSHRQGPENRMSLVIRAAGSPTSLVALIRSAVRELDAALPVYAVGAMASQIDESPAVLARRFPLTLITAFAAAALLLAVIGIYGVISYSVTQRTREMGVRMALGATASNLVRTVLRQGIRLAGLGILLGTALAFFASRVLGTLLYGVSASDPLTYLGVGLLLALVALAASWLPARRAGRVDPLTAIRAE
ncbi:MAG TPA: ABC transporter permease [Gemmatimonadales bacterium]|nr:ABC transporter permease [Gemmatimonadales bacterium]